jgi:hypothetical protein
MRQNSLEKMKKLALINHEEIREHQSDNSEPKPEPPKKKLKLSFLRKMEKALVPTDPPAETPATP